MVGNLDDATQEELLKQARNTFFETKRVFCLNRLGKNFIPDQFSFQALAVKEGRRRKKSQREEHGRRKRKRKEIGHVTKVNTEHLVTSRTTCEA